MTICTPQFCTIPPYLKNIRAFKLKNLTIYTSHFHNTYRYFFKKYWVHKSNNFIICTPFSYHTSLLKAPRLIKPATWLFAHTLLFKRKARTHKPNNLTICTPYFHTAPHYLKKSGFIDLETWLFAQPIFTPHFII